MLDHPAGHPVAFPAVWAFLAGLFVGGRSGRLPDSEKQRRWDAKQARKAARRGQWKVPAGQPIVGRGTGRFILLAIGATVIFLVGLAVVRAF